MAARVWTRLIHFIRSPPFPCFTSSSLKNLHHLLTGSQARMCLVTVHCLSNEDLMTISFTHDGKQRNLKRPKTEPLEKSLTRINLSIQNLKRKAKKEKVKEDSISDLSISLWYQDKKVDENLLNIEAWKDGSELRIGERTLKVEVNPPRVVSLTLPSHIMAEFAIFPVLELQFAEVKHCIFEWFRSKDMCGDTSNATPTVPTTEWVKIGSNFFYKPDVCDIGRYIKLVCTAGACDRTSSTTSEVTSCTKVSAAPGFCPFENRHLYTCKKLGNESFRFVGYNILADMYAREDFAVNVLYPYCPPYALDIGYRKQVLLKELTGYNADILCLQECGVHVFDSFLQQSMKMLGYEGMLKCKAGKIPEGEAIFFNAEKFEFVSSHDIVLKESLIEDPINKELIDHVSSVPAFLDNLMKKNSVAQITILKVKSKRSHYLCVVNTHLYFKPNSPHIRLVQAAIILNQTKKVVNNFSSLHHAPLGKEGSSNQEVTKTEEILENMLTKEDKKIAVIFCGDLNSTPRSALVQLLNDGNIGTNHQDWTAFEEADQHCTMNLSHDFYLFSACGIPPFTNYTSGFKDTVDYIFCDSQQIEVEAVIPLPLEEELSMHTALPSVVMPSDHLALVCDLRWKT